METPVNKNLIVFCPGYSGLPNIKHNMLLKRFQRDGFDTISINYKFFGRGDITQTAEIVVKVIKPLRDLYDHIALIGHSMGGLVARKALMIDPMLSDSLVTIGSPHRGTQAANRAFAWLGGWSAEQMKPDSKFLKYLTIPDVPTLTLTGEWDFLVKDGSMRNLYGTEIFGRKNVPKDIRIPYGEHTMMLFSHRVYGEIYSWLVYGILDRLV